MTEEEAKNVIRNDPYGNILDRLEAIEVAKLVFGEDVTMEQIWKWTKEDTNEEQFGTQKQT